MRTCRIGDCVREKLPASLRAALEAVREGQDGLPRHVRQVPQNVIDWLPENWARLHESDDGREVRQDKAGRRRCYIDHRVYLERHERIVRHRRGVALLIAKHPAADSRARRGGQQQPVLVRVIERLNLGQMRPLTVRRARLQGDDAVVSPLADAANFRVY